MEIGPVVDAIDDKYRQNLLSHALKLKQQSAELIDLLLDEHFGSIKKKQFPEEATSKMNVSSAINPDDPGVEYNESYFKMLEACAIRYLEKASIILGEATDKCVQAKKALENASSCSKNELLLYALDLKEQACQLMDLSMDVTFDSIKQNQLREEAMSMLQEAFTINSDDPEVEYNMSYIKMLEVCATGDFEKASIILGEANEKCARAIKALEEASSGRENKYGCRSYQAPDSPVRSGQTNPRNLIRRYYPDGSFGYFVSPENYERYCVPGTGPGYVEFQELDQAQQAKM